MESYLPVVFFLIASVSAISAITVDTSNGLPVVGDRWAVSFLWPKLGYPAEEFQSKAEMNSYLQSHLTDDSVVINADPVTQDGKYVEVLSSKAISSNAVKMVCHYYETKPAMCHSLVKTDEAPETKFLYSTVKKIDDGSAFPVLIASHKVCLGNECSWEAHTNEVVVLDKNVI